MGKLKFEKEFSEKLESRKIEPKEESWKQLNKRLNSSVENKKSHAFWWMGIAATIVGGILIFGTFFNESVINSPGIVVVPVESHEQEENKIQHNSSEEIKPEEIAFEEKEEVIETSVIKNKLKVSEEKKSSIGNNKNSVAVVDKSIKMQEPIPKEPEVVVAEISEVSQSIQDAIAEVVLQQGSGNITEAEVDALLARAATEISQIKNDKFSSDNIDAGSLLREVEFEMEESFRDKVFEVLKEGYLKARTAVVNRNN